MGIYNSSASGLEAITVRRLPEDFRNKTSVEFEQRIVKQWRNVTWYFLRFL